MKNEMDRFRFPIGRFQSPEEVNKNLLDHWIGEIASLPMLLKSKLDEMSSQDMVIPYRPGGWNTKQVVHHLADSHMNAYIRFKLALTEENPVIRPYHEDLWARGADYQSDIDLSLLLLEALHAKWVRLLRTLTMQQMSRGFSHPERNESINLAWNIGNYAWHGNHHCAHIDLVKEGLL